MRLSFGGVLLLWLLLFAWVLPWPPIGLTAGAYDATTIAVLVLAIAAALASTTFGVVWAPLFHHEPLPEFLRVLFGAHQLIRRRRQFHSRLRSQCRSARRDRRRGFSLIVIQRNEALRDPPQGQPARTDNSDQTAALLARSVVRAEDTVAAPAPHEVWLLALGVGQEARDRVVERLARAFNDASASAGSPEPWRIGASTFGADGESPDALFSAATGRQAPLRDPGRMSRAA